jgi:rubrerythrin
MPAERDTGDYVCRVCGYVSEDEVAGNCPDVEL